MGLGASRARRTRCLRVYCRISPNAAAHVQLQMHPSFLPCFLPTTPPTHPPPQQSPRYCLQVLPGREKDIAKTAPRRRLLDGAQLFPSPPFSLPFLPPRWRPRMNQIAPVDKGELCNASTTDTGRREARACISPPLSFSVSACKRCSEGKTHPPCSAAPSWCHADGCLSQTRRIPTWFPPECAARRSVCIPLEFLPYIYSALGHGRWFWCLLFISFLCPSSTLPLPLKRHRNTTGASRQVTDATAVLFLWK